MTPLMMITVHITSDDVLNFSISVRSGSSVRELKERVCEHSPELLVDRQYLVHGVIVLEDSMRLMVGVFDMIPRSEWVNMWIVCKRRRPA